MEGELTIARALAALTYDQRETQDGTSLPSLSIATELRQIEKELGALGLTRLAAIADAIDEAIMELGGGTNAR